MLLLGFLHCPISPTKLTRAWYETLALSQTNNPRYTTSHPRAHCVPVSPTYLSAETSSSGRPTSVRPEARLASLRSESRDAGLRWYTCHTDPHHHQGDTVVYIRLPVTRINGLELSRLLHPLRSPRSPSLHRECDCSRTSLARHACLRSPVVTSGQQRDPYVTIGCLKYSVINVKCGTQVYAVYGCSKPCRGTPKSAETAGKAKGRLPHGPAPPPTER